MQHFARVHRKLNGVYDALLLILIILFLPRVLIPRDDDDISRARAIHSRCAFAIKEATGGSASSIYTYTYVSYKLLMHPPRYEDCE